MVITKARTDYLIEDVIIMKIPDGFSAVTPSSATNVGKRSNDVIISREGNITFGKTVLSKLEESYGGLVVGGSTYSFPYSVVVVSANAESKSIAFSFGTMTGVRKLEKELGQQIKWYTFSTVKKVKDKKTKEMKVKGKNGISALGVLRTIDVPEIEELVDSNAGELYEWTITKVTGEDKEETVTKRQKVLLVKKDDSEGYITSMRFSNPEVDTDSKTITVSTEDWSYQTKTLGAEEQANKTVQISAKKPVKKTTRTRKKTG